MTECVIKLIAADDFTLDAFRVTPENPKGGLVVLQEIFGVGEQLKSVARRFAELGFDTIAPALFDRVSPNTIIPFEDVNRGRETMLKLNIDEVMLDVAAAVKQVESGNGVTVLGFCWGGGMAMRAAGQLKLAGAVSYYGTSLNIHTRNGTKCPTLFHFGETDSLVAPEIIEAVKQAIADAEIYTYAAGHAFANEARSSYVPEAATQAWERTAAFLNKVHNA